MTSKPASRLHTTATSRRSLRAPTSRDASSSTTSLICENRRGECSFRQKGSLYRVPSQWTRRWPSFATCFVRRGPIGCTGWRTSNSLMGSSCFLFTPSVLSACRAV